MLSSFSVSERFRVALAALRVVGTVEEARRSARDDGLRVGERLEKARRSDDGLRAGEPLDAGDADARPAGAIRECADAISNATVHST